MKITLGSLYLCVHDMARAVSFYEALLDMPVTERDELYSVFDLHGFRLGLFAFAQAGETHAFGSNCLPSLEVEDMALFRARLEALDAPQVFPLTQIGPNLVMEFADSEGNHIEATQPIG